MELQLYNVAPRIPAELVFLEKLSNNIWWCWHQCAIELFMRIDPNLWREVGGNAKMFLRMVSGKRLNELAHDAGFLRNVQAVQSEFERQNGNRFPPEQRNIAYFLNRRILFILVLWYYNL